MIASPETGIAMAKALGKNNAVLLAAHGAVTVSTVGPEDCIQALIALEQLCKMNWLAFTALGHDYVKYALDDATINESLRLSSTMKDRFATPGKDLTKDQCYYNAAMARTFREAIEG